MKNEFVSISDLIPAQWGVRESSLVKKLLKNFQPSEFKPIPTIDIDGKRVMGGGHNRAFLVYLLEQTYGKRLDVQTVCVESDDEIKNFFDGDFKKSGIKGFREYFKVFSKSAIGNIESPKRVQDLRYEVTKLNPWRTISTYNSGVYVYTSNTDKNPEHLGNLPPIDLVLKTKSLR